MTSSSLAVALTSSTSYAPAIVGFLAHHAIEEHLFTPAVVAGSLIAGGLVLLAVAAEVEVSFVAGPEDALAMFRMAFHAGADAAPEFLAIARRIFALRPRHQRHHIGEAAVDRAVEPGGRGAERAGGGRMKPDDAMPPARFSCAQRTGFGSVGLSSLLRA